MRFFPYFSRVYHSPLAPAEIVRRMQGSTRPLANASWQDDYQIDPSQPFQGVVRADSFEIARLCVDKVRRSEPPKIKGWISAMPGGAGTEIRVLYYNPLMLKFIAGLGVLAVGSSVASMVQDWRHTGAINPLGLVYLILPIFAVVWQYSQLRAESDTVQPLLVRLLALSETAE